MIEPLPLPDGALVLLEFASPGFFWAPVDVDVGPEGQSRDNPPLAECSSGRADGHCTKSIIPQSSQCGIYREYTDASLADGIHCNSLSLTFCFLVWHCEHAEALRPLLRALPGGGPVFADDDGST